ncbi:Extracellular cystatin-like protease inhibitor [Phytophthora cinnamomi]|uniref:Extracellular cystatin-like protease inhibitor n=1 Tax=Phytophthora cinnamomi TaxID=4785 RepID=UPI00355A3F30|nr:Extracellular cystatin-like protease inhibitor [Phytophthora cinnamomi]
MPYLRAITSSIFALALVSVSVPGAQAGSWTKTTVTDADTTLLLSAVGDVSTYSSGVATFLCVYKVNSLETQAGTAGGIANYDFGVTACNAGGKEFVGRCPDLTTYPDCGNYNIFVSSNSGKPRVTKVKKPESKQTSAEGSPLDTQRVSH